MNTPKSLEIIFICSSVIFNVSVSIVYIATKLYHTALLRTSGAIIISLILPFTITLLGFIDRSAEKKIIIPNAVILLYLLLELSLDYILKIPFREILAIHVPYIMFFYAAEFSMISISFNVNRKAGISVVLTFFALIGGLIYLYMG